MVIACFGGFFYSAYNYTMFIVQPGPSDINDNKSRSVCCKSTFKTCGKIWKVPHNLLDTSFFCFFSGSFLDQMLPCPSAQSPLREMLLPDARQVRQVHSCL